MVLRDHLAPQEHHQRQFLDLHDETDEALVVPKFVFGMTITPEGVGLFILNFTTDHYRPAFANEGVSVNFGYGCSSVCKRRSVCELWLRVLK